MTVGKAKPHIVLSSALELLQSVSACQFFNIPAAELVGWELEGPGDSD